MLLLVDDNDEFRKAAAEALEAAGLEVLEAGDADEAFAMFQEEAITLLVTDLRLPGESASHLSAGEELARKCLAKKPELPVIVVSSHADADLPTRLGSAKVEILAKPFPLEKLARRSIALLAGEAAESTGALPAAVMKKRQEATDLGRRASLAKNPRGPWPYLAAAAALVLFLAAGWWALAPAAPKPAPLKEVPNPVSVKIEPIAPVGPIGELPQELAWQKVAGASRYKVALRGVDDVVLWQSETGANRLELPQEISQELRPALAYFWSVEALSSSSEKIAAAPAIRFRYVPPSKSPSTGG